MNIEEFVAISGMPGVYKVASSRSNGILVEDLDTGRVKFYPARKHQFTPMATVAIYTLEDTTELKTVFQSMKDKKSDLPVPAINADKMVLLEYFEQILPDYDEDRVYVSDIKKVIKWFTFLDSRNLLESVDNDEEE